MRVTPVLIILFAFKLWAQPAGLPLPGQSMHLARGVFTGMGLGPLARFGCQTLTQWQGMVQYSYLPTLSGGASLRIYGGNLDSTISINYSRFFLHSRFHLRSERFNLYGGPVLGLDNANIGAIRSDLESLRNPTGENGVSHVPQGVCNDLFDVGGLGVGYEIGFGWNFVPAWALVGQHALEISMQGESNFLLGGGIAFDIHRYWLRLQRPSRAFWLYLEWVAVLNMKRLKSDNSIIGGAAVGF